MGLDREMSLRHISLTQADLSNLKTRIHMDKLRDLLDFASRELNEPNIGMQVGYRFRVATFTETGSILALCGTIAEAVQINAMYQTLTETMGASGLERREDGVFMIWDENFDKHDEYRHATELVFAGYATTTNWLSWGFQKGVETVYFKHQKPKDMVGFEMVFGMDVRFGADRNQIKFNSETVDQALPTSNPEKLAYVRHRLDEIMERVEQKSGISQRISHIIHEGIKDQQVGFDYVARNIGMSPRNLRRLLKEEGHSYRDILANVRKNLCQTYMRQGKTFTEIAQLLAYNDQSAFTRAFKKWYGVSPTEYQPDVISL
ncbi:AraC family transcriptional regulator ligand-binding domain-containing protein [Litorimonas sp. RW-G-Af-16]|uniref:AraC family transcriptional regulator n=1 Tax=Litorimonas sp. RW-G-Af-16 TaxID=3241168 RepID=UPI00390C55BD